MSKEETGKLKIQVFAGGDAFPVAGAKILIMKENVPEAFLITDENGETPFVELPSPSVENSLDPGHSVKSYFYRADIEADGFYPLKSLPIEEVGGTTSVLKVNLVPLYEGGKAYA